MKKKIILDLKYGKKNYIGLIDFQIKYSWLYININEI